MGRGRCLLRDTGVRYTGVLNLTGGNRKANRTMSFIEKVKAVSKPIVAFVGLVALYLVKYYDLVPVQYQGYAAAFVAVATLIGAYHAPYAPLGGSATGTTKVPQ